MWDQFLATFELSIFFISPIFSYKWWIWYTQECVIWTGNFMAPYDLFTYFYGFVENLRLTKPLCSKHSTWPCYFLKWKHVSCLGKWLSLFLHLSLFSLSLTCLPAYLFFFSLSWKYIIYSHALVMGDLINLCYMWMCVLLKCLWI